MENKKIEILEKNVQNLEKKLEELDQRLSLVESQIKTIQSALQEKAKEIVATNQISKIVPEPAKGEREYLEALLSDKIVQPWKLNLQKVEKETLNGLVDLLADTVIKVRNWNDRDKKISNTDHQKFLESFINQLVDSSFSGNVDSNPKLMAIEAGVKALVITSKFVVAKYNEYKKSQRLIDYWNDETELIKKEIKKYLRHDSDHALKMMLDDFCTKYTANFNRDDCQIKSLENEEDTPDFQRKFDKISNYTHETPKNSERSFELKQVCDLFKGQEKYRFNLKLHAKLDIASDDLQKLNQQFRLYRAIKQIGEFSDIVDAGDHYGGRRAGISVGLAPIFGIGLITGIVWGSQRGYYEYAWHDNTWRLKEKMVKCIYGYSDDVLNEILKKREILSHIKIFADATGSKYAQHFYEECKKDSYKGIKKKEEFDQLYDLYYKLTNTGLANKENLYKYSFQLEQVDSIESSPAYDFVMEAVNRNKSKFNNITSSANDNTSNQTSGFVLAQVGNAAIRGLI